MMPSPIRAEYHRWASESSASTTASPAMTSASRTTRAGLEPDLGDRVDHLTGEHRGGHPDDAAEHHGDQEDGDVPPVRPGEGDDPLGRCRGLPVRGHSSRRRASSAMLQPPMPPTRPLGSTIGPAPQLVGSHGPSGSILPTTTTTSAVIRIFPERSCYSPRPARSRMRRVCASRSARSCSAWVRRRPGQQRLDLHHRVAGRPAGGGQVGTAASSSARHHQVGQADPVRLGRVHPPAR